MSWGHACKTFMTTRSFTGCAVFLNPLLRHLPGVLWFGGTLVYIAPIQALSLNALLPQDFKPRNAVRLVEEARRDAETRDDYVKDRVGDIDKWQLIDLDASVSLIDAGGSPSTSTGRFSWRFLLCSAWLSGFVSSPTGGTGQQKDDTAWRGRRRRRPPPHADERYLTRKCVSPFSSCSVH